jgi:hypothetical protein
MYVKAGLARCMVLTGIDTIIDTSIDTIDTIIPHIHKYTAYTAYTH